MFWLPLILNPASVPAAGKACSRGRHSAIYESAGSSNDAYGAAGHYGHLAGLGDSKLVVATTAMTSPRDLPSSTHRAWRIVCMFIAWITAV
jgi:hypothetical protein